MHAGRHEVRDSSATQGIHRLRYARHLVLGCWVPLLLERYHRTCPFRATTSSAGAAVCATQASSGPSGKARRLSPGEKDPHGSNVLEIMEALDDDAKQSTRASAMPQGQRDSAESKQVCDLIEEAWTPYLSSLTRCQMLLDCARARRQQPHVFGQTDWEKAPARRRPWRRCSPATAPFAAPPPGRLDASTCITSSTAVKHGNVRSDPDQHARRDGANDTRP